MEHASEDAPLAADSRAGSEQVLVEPTVTTGSSNSRALKIAGLTTLACLLLASQIFTAYMVFNQKQQIQGLQTTNLKMEKQMEKQMAQRSRVTPQKMVMPIGSLPLLDYFDDSSKTAPKMPPKSAPPNKPQDVAPPSVEKQLQELMKESELPHFNQSFMANLQALREEANETDWKSFESWLRYWLIFQMAQKTSAPTPQQALLTKCQEEASGRRGALGAYRPQCDEQGNYKTMQCWHATQYCWCVDQNGNRIEGTSVQGYPDCDKVINSRASNGPMMMPDLTFDDVNN